MMQAPQILLTLDVITSVPTPFNLHFWIDNNDDKIIDNNGDYLVFNVPTP